MIQSMTGYALAADMLSGYEITVELRSVNHRFFEFSPRVPRAYVFLEDKLKALVGKYVARGKVDLNVKIIQPEEKELSVKVNTTLARAYLNELTRLSEELSVHNDVTVSDFLNFQDIFDKRRPEEDLEAIEGYVLGVAKTACEKLVLMRTAEGERLLADINENLLGIRASLSQVERIAPDTVKEYRERLYSKLCEVLNDNPDPQRVLTEAAIFAERVATDEETVRLNSHLDMFASLLEGGERQVGRKLDFVVQEMNREVNTIGSKAQSLEVTKHVVSMKSDIEKIREQIQNVE